MSKFLSWGGVFLIITLMGSCLSYKKSLYFNDNDVTSIAPISLSESYKLRIRDIIQVKISSPDIDDKVISTSNNTSGTMSGQTTNYYFIDYLISDSGNVDLPIVGIVKVNGLTIRQIDSLITSMAHEYSSLYYVEVRLASFEISCLGEFKRGGKVLVANEYCNIFEAISLGGDLTDYANKKKMKIIRTNEDWSKTVIPVDLTKYDAFTYENYYIQPHDILYVESQKAKVDKQNLTIVSFSIGLISAVYLIIQAIGK